MSGPLESWLFAQECRGFSMQFVVPDILADARELSVTATAIGLALGVLLWLFGWWGHRFWIVLGVTVAGGVAGLSSSGVQPLVAGLLAAIAAGVLALALVRVVAFAAGGVAGYLVVHTVAPTFEQPLVCALAGGLVGVFLFRLLIMILTSAVGSLLATYCGLCLLDRAGTLHSVSWADSNAVLLSWVIGSATVLGVLTQYLIERRRVLKQKKCEEAKKAEESDKKNKKSEAPAKKKFWPWGQAKK
jgi:MFS family permease